MGQAFYKMKLHGRDQGPWATCILESYEETVENSKQGWSLVRKNPMQSGSGLSGGEDRANRRQRGACEAPDPA